MKTITSTDLLEEIELGAVVCPQESENIIYVRIGRFEFLCDLRTLSEEQQTRFIELYKRCQIDFGCAADFTVMPFFFTNKRSRTRRVRIGLWDVFWPDKPVAEQQENSPNPCISSNSSIAFLDALLLKIDREGASQVNEPVPLTSEPPQLVAS